MRFRYAVALIFTGVLSAQSAPSPGFNDAEAARQEAAVASDPDNVRLRERLLLYYSLAPPAELARVEAMRRRHALWLVEHDPANWVLRRDRWAMDREGYLLLEAAWKKHFAGDAPSAAVYANAVQFFESSDAPYARKLADEGHNKHPRDAELASRAGRARALLVLGAKGTDRYGRFATFDDAVAGSEEALAIRAELEAESNADVLAGAGDAFSSETVPLMIQRKEKRAADAAALAQRLLERANKIDPSNERAASSLRRLYQSSAAKERDPAAKLAILNKAAAVPGEDRARSFLQVDLARAQLEAGETPAAAATARALLDGPAKDPKDGNHGNAVHWGNIVLGLIAVKEGKVEEAANRLLAAGATPGSPVLGSFGPDWQLAKELVNKGETAVVLDYIELCRKFWKMGGSALDFWAGAIRDGAVPTFSPIERATGGRRTDAEVMALIGKPAPELRLKDLSGKTVALADFQGKVVLVDFWATWCAPCRTEMPIFEKLHREFAGKDIAILTVDADEPEETATQYMKDEKLTFPVLLAEGTDTAKRYGIVAFPTTIAIDAEGRVAAVAVGGRGEGGLRELITKARK